MAVEFAPQPRRLPLRDLPANVMLGDFGEPLRRRLGLALERGERVEGVSSSAARPTCCRRWPRASPSTKGPTFLLGATLHQVISGELRHAAPTVVLSLMRAAAAEPHEYR
ncbi:MAG: hypothetical protein R3A51_21410 [Nannocystaceae bacterium]